MGQDSSHSQPLVDQTATEAREITLSDSGVSVDQTPFELELFLGERLRLRELGHRDDVDEHELGTVLLSKADSQRQSALGAR